VASIHKINGRKGGRPKGRFVKHPRLIPQLVPTTGLCSGWVSIQLAPENWALIYREAALIPRHCAWTRKRSGTSRNWQGRRVWPIKP
jgi:hypothetical protein